MADIRPNPSYIVSSEITMVDAAHPGMWEDVVFGSRDRFAMLRPEFGFVVVSWCPDAPELVQEIRWHTKEEQRHFPYVGRIIERAATPVEREDGERQHERRSGQ